MSGEKFLIHFNSQGANVVNNSNLNSVSYDVDWVAFLPSKYKTFKCNFIFKSIANNGLLTTNGLVNMNVGKQQIYDGNSQSYNIGSIIPISNSSGTTLAFTGIAFQSGSQITIKSVSFGSLAVGYTFQISGGVIQTITGGPASGGAGTYYGTSLNSYLNDATALFCYATTNFITTYYSSAASDNSDFYINYPNNQLITINLRQFDNTALLSGNGANNTPSKNLHYVLTLCLEGVEE